MQHKPLRLLGISVVGAGVFVVLRVFYRFLFGGASSGDTVLPHLAPVRLAGPFSHIVLFGPVTLEGMVQAAASAVPFALAILATGALVALWDPRRIITLAPRIPGAGSLVLAAGIAVATLPLVLDTITTTRRNLMMRGIRPGLRSFVPVLETTIERSVHIARALESRGLAPSHQRMRLPPGSESQVVSFEQFEVPSRRLGPLSWEIRAGTAAVLTGATGSGKTTVLESIAGVVNLRGDAPWRGLCESGFSPDAVSYLPHDPSTVFLTSRVIDDIAFGLIAKGTASSVARKAAATELAHCGLEHLSNRAPGTLSSGEAALVALVMVMATKPQLLLLDEPLSALSRPSAERFMALLERYRAETGATVLMTDHPRGDATLAGWEYWQLGATGIAPGRHQATPGVSHRIPYRPHEADRVLRVKDLSMSFGEHVVLQEVSLDVSRGETCLIVGDNAAGKSTLLRALATSSEAEIELRGVRLSGRTAHRRVSRIAAVPSEPQDLLISSSVAEELRLADRIARVQEGMTALTLQSILPALWHTSSLASQHPRDLSRGQQTALAIAIQLSHKPAVLLLDEPMRGLDEAARSALAEVLACVVETGTAVVVASHHAHQSDLPHDRVLHLEKGLLIEKLVEVPQ